MRMSEKCLNNSKHNNNNNSDNPLTSRRTDGGKKKFHSKETKLESPAISEYVFIRWSSKTIDDKMCLSNCF